MHAEMSHHISTICFISIYNKQEHFGNDRREFLTREHRKNERE